MSNSSGLAIIGAIISLVVVIVFGGVLVYIGLSMPVIGGAFILGGIVGILAGIAGIVGILLSASRQG